VLGVKRVSLSDAADRASLAFGIRGEALRLRLQDGQRLR